jgi:hypothetical protein
MKLSIEHVKYGQRHAKATHAVVEAAKASGCMVVDMRRERCSEPFTEDLAEVLGPQKYRRFFDLAPVDNSDPDEATRGFEALLRVIDEGSDVVMLCDCVGNCCWAKVWALMAQMRRPNLEVDWNAH